MNKFFYITVCTLGIVFSQAALSSHDMNFDNRNFNQEFNSLDNIIARNRKGRGKLNEWKVLKGLAGLWIGTQGFLSCGTGTLFFLVCPPLSDTELPFTDLSLAGKLIRNRFLWISLFSSLTAFSLWLLKRSVANIYYGFNGTENDIEYGNEY